MVLGWGLFNLIEGIINHHLLEVHHVIQRSVGTEQILWDLGFDASGVALIIVGSYMRRKSLGMHTKNTELKLKSLSTAQA